MKFVIGAVASLLLAHSAIACEGKAPPNCDCKGNQWVSKTTGQVVVNSQASSVASANQLQLQGQQQGQQQTVSNSGNNKASATGGQATIASGAVTNTNTNNVTGGNSNAVVEAGAVQSINSNDSSASASNNGNGSNNTSIEYEAAKTYRQPVATAYSASLTSGADTCLGSWSAGGQSQILGLTFGKTKQDKNCILIKQTALLKETGHERAACFRMQMGDEGKDIREAMKAAGDECPPLVAPPVVVVTPPVVVGPPVDAVTHAEMNEVERRITTKVTQK